MRKRKPWAAAQRAKFAGTIARRRKPIASAKQAEQSPLKAALETVLQATEELRHSRSAMTPLTKDDALSLKRLLETQSSARERILRLRGRSSSPI
jgi:hypothetical protein